MPTSAKVIADSISPVGIRITTMQLKFHRFVLSEFNTHRVFSRNASSSRAIPVERMIKQVEEDPAMPLYWGKNQKGMQAVTELEREEKEEAIGAWKRASWVAIDAAKEMIDLGVHKQLANRLLEPWQWAHVVVTSTEWKNFFALRRHKDAQPEIQAVANLMYDALQASTPVERKHGDWHLPYVAPEERQILSMAEQLRCSVARCARVSFINHDGTAPNLVKDVELYDRLALADPPHMSPLEHQATPDVKYTGNFKGWCQWRKIAEFAILPEEYFEAQHKPEVSVSRS